MINLFRVLESSYTDGPGNRTVIYLQGCDIQCPFCQSKHTWDATSPFSSRVDEDELARKVAEMAKGKDGVTISGGDPLFQPGPLAFLIRSLRKYGVTHIIVYTGNSFEELIDPVNPKYIWILEILPMIDVLVDGRFIKALDHGEITYRGSSNQRPIDVQATLKAESLVVLDWSDNEIEISPTGEVYLPIDTAKEFAAFGQAERTRMCGSSKF